VTYEVVVEVRGLEGLADPEGLAIERALPALRIKGVHDVHVGRVIRFGLDANDPEEARREAEALCERLLANPVTERASIRIEGAPA
jgi:phosphoribosylformylglycinamidine synthase subunit PurS